jgi:hypothetical protein
VWTAQKQPAVYMYHLPFAVYCSLCTSLSLLVAHGNLCGIMGLCNLCAAICAVQFLSCVLCMSTCCLPAVRRPACPWQQTRQLPLLTQPPGGKEYRRAAAVIQGLWVGFACRLRGQKVDHKSNPRDRAQNTRQVAQHAACACQPTANPFRWQITGNSAALKHCVTRNQTSPPPSAGA